jgi:hypothetical protein
LALLVGEAVIGQQVVWIGHDVVQVSCDRQARRTARWHIIGVTKWAVSAAGSVRDSLLTNLADEVNAAISVLDSLRVSMSQRQSVGGRAIEWPRVTGPQRLFSYGVAETAGWVVVVRGGA